MAIFLYYRKKTSKSANYPWQQLCKSAKEAAEFMDKLGDEYQFCPFEQINTADVYDMAYENGYEAPTTQQEGGQ